MPDKKPAFNPDQSYEPVDVSASSKPAFDPNKGFEPVDQVGEPSAPVAPARKNPNLPKPLPLSGDAPIVEKPEIIKPGPSIQDTYKKAIVNVENRVAQNTQLLTESAKKYQDIYAQALQTNDPELEKQADEAKQVYLKVGESISSDNAKLHILRGGIGNINEENRPAYSDYWNKLGAPMLGSFVASIPVEGARLASTWNLMQQGMPMEQALMTTNYQISESDILDATQNFVKHNQERTAKAAADLEAREGTNFIKELDAGNYSKAINLAMKQGVASAPLSLALGASAAGGTPAIGAIATYLGTAGMKEAELTDRKDMSESTKFANAQGNAFFETAFEFVPDYIGGDMIKGLVKNIGRKPAELEMRRSLVGAMYDTYKKAFVITQPMAEGLGEVGTGIGQRMIDIYTDPNLEKLSDVDKNTYIFGENYSTIKEEFAGGMAGATMFVAPAVVLQGSSTLLSMQSNTKVNELLQKKSQIQDDIANGVVKGDAVKILQDQVGNITEEVNGHIKQNYDATDNLSSEDKSTAQNVISTIQDIDESMKDGNIQDATSEALQNSRKEQEGILTQLTTLPQDGESSVSVEGEQLIKTNPVDDAVREAAKNLGVELDINDVPIIGALHTESQTTEKPLSVEEAINKHISEKVDVPLKEQLIKANKITVNKKGNVEDVRQNSGASSQLFKDLTEITGDKETALTEYLKLKEDKGDFKTGFADWENNIMKDYGRSGREYSIERPDKTELENHENDYAWSSEKNGKPVVYFNDNKLSRKVPFKEQKQGYIDTVINPELEQYKADGNEETAKKMEQYKKLFEENVNSNRDLKLHLIHTEMYGIMNTGKDITPQDIDKNGIRSVNEVARLNTVELAKDYFGEPMIYAHAGPEGITKFNKPGESGYKKNDEYTGEGIYFSRDIRNQEKYSGFDKGKPAKGKDIYYTFLKYKNAYHMDDEQAQAKYPITDIKTITKEQRTELEKLGYDAIIKSSVDRPKEEIVVFEPSQVEIIGSYNQGLIKKGESDATKDRKITESNQPEHQEGDGGGKKSETISSDSAEQGGKVKEEVKELASPQEKGEKIDENKGQTEETQKTSEVLTEKKAGDSSPPAVIDEQTKELVKLAKPLIEIDELQREKEKKNTPAQKKKIQDQIDKIQETVDKENPSMEDVKKVMDNIDEIRAQLMEKGLISKIECKW